PALHEARLVGFWAYDECATTLPLPPSGADLLRPARRRSAAWGRRSRAKRHQAHRPAARRGVTRRPVHAARPGRRGASMTPTPFNVGVFVQGATTSPRALVRHGDLLTAYADGAL